MAKDVITRFKLETTGFDSKIKEAAKELSAYSKTATQAKEGFNQFTKANVDAAKALGTMATSTINAKDRAKELVGAYNEAAKAYEALSDEHKQSDWAKALAGSLTQLQQRIKETKAEMQGLDNSMKNVGGGFLSGLGDKMGGAIQVFGGNMMTAAAGAVANLGAEMADMVKQGIEMARAGEGVRIAFERLGRGDILDGLREATHGTVTDLELMKAAVKFNDFKLPVEELGTMLAFAQQKAKDTGQSVDYMVDSIVTGLGRKSLMILDNLGLSATEIKNKMAETGDMTKAVGAIIREQMAKAGDYVETAADRAAQANVSLQNKMEELGRKFAPLEEASNTFWTSVKISILDVVGGPLADFLNGLTEAGRRMWQLNKLQGGGNGQPTKVGRQLSALGGSNFKNEKYRSQLAQYDQDIKVAEYYKKKYQEAGWTGGSVLSDVTRRFGINATSGEDIENLISNLKVMRAEYQNGAKEILNPIKPVIDTTDAVKSLDKLKVKLAELQAQRKKVAAGTDEAKRLDTEIRQVKADIKLQDPNALKTSTKQYDEIQKIQEKIAKLTKEAYTADEDRVAEITKEIAGLQAQEKKLTDIRDLVTGKKEDKGFDFVNQYDTGSVSPGQAYIDQVKADLAQSNIDADMAKLAQLMTDGLRAGLQEQDMTDIASELKQKIAEGGDVPDEVWQELEEYIQENLDNADFSFKIDFESKNVEDAAKKQKKEAKEMAKEWQAAGSAIQAVGNAMEQIEDPAAKVLGTIAQAVATMALSYAQAANSKAVTGTGWGWIAFAATGLATMLTSIAAIKQATAGFAGGGIYDGGGFVPGNKYSGDLVPANGGTVGLNSGELILNHAQQGVIAQELEGGGIGNMQLETFIEAEGIRVVLNNNGRRTGKGEYVQSRNRRG